MKTLLCGYSLVTMAVSFEPLFEKPTATGAPDAPWFALNTLLGFYDTIERIDIRVCALGGLCFSLILQCELTMRQERTTLNTMSPNLTLILTRCEGHETNWGLSNFSGVGHPFRPLTNLCGVGGGE